MANTIRDYSATAASNTAVDGADISEGCSPAGINDAIRGVMADLKDVSTGAVALESPAADSLTVTGNVSAATFSGDGSSLTGIPTPTLTSLGIANHDDITVDGSGNLDVTGTVTADGLTVDGTGTSNFTSTATSPVQINGTSIPTLTVRNSTTPVETQFRSTTGEGLVRTATNHPLVFGTNAAERLRITSGGDLIKVGGVIKGERGTAAAPAYSFSDDTDTGMFNIANADLGFSVGGSERLRIDSSGRVTMPYQPAFFASGGGGSFNSSGIFVGDSSAVQKTNVGGHYSYSTGRFTAPVAGVYMFSYLLTTNDTSSHMVNIHINGADNLQPVLNYYNDYDSATNVVIFTLAANDYVEAHLRASSGYGYYGARFCGHLIG